MVKHHTMVLRHKPPARYIRCNACGNVITDIIPRKFQVPVAQRCNSCEAHVCRFCLNNMVANIEQKSSSKHGHFMPCCFCAHVGAPHHWVCNRCHSQIACHPPRPVKTSERITNICPYLVAQHMHKVKWHVKTQNLIHIRHISDKAFGLKP